MRELFFDESDFPERMQLAVDLKREYDSVDPEDLLESACLEGELSEELGSSVYVWSPTEYDSELGQFWSLREERRTDKEWRVYSPEERRAYEDFVAANPGRTMPAIKPWSFPAFTGAASKPRRIGG